MKTEIGIVRIGTIAEGKCQRKINITIETIIISSSNFSFKL